MKEPKDISVLVPGQFRPHIKAVKQNWPVSQVKVVSAALYHFAKVSADEQGEILREIATKGAKQSRPSRRSASAA